MDPLVAEIKTLLESARNPARAVSMAAYMKNHFPFLGMPRTTARKLIAPTLVTLRKETSESRILEIATELWAMPEREYQYSACDVLGTGSKRLTEKSVPVLRELALQKSWWDSIDDLRAQAFAPLLTGNPHLVAVMDEWIQAPEMWLNRIAITFQLNFRGRTDTARLFRYCQAHRESKEFFIQKGMGWALREYAKTDANAVQRFLSETPMPRLTVREATKHLGKMG